MEIAAEKIYGPVAEIISKMQEAKPEEMAELMFEFSRITEKADKVSSLDRQESEATCMIIYKSAWNKLDSLTKEYLITANYLYKLLSLNKIDLSPSVLEFGLAVENELIEKIYTGYVSKLSADNSGMIDKGRLYGDLKNAL